VLQFTSVVTCAQALSSSRVLGEESGFSLGAFAVCSVVTCVQVFLWVSMKWYAVCCSMLQYVAVVCSRLQWYAVGCSGLQ